MKVGDKVDLNLFRPRKVEWDSGFFKYLKRLECCFIFARFSGFNIYPHQLLREEVSWSHRIWSGLIFAASCTWSVQSVVFFCCPSLIPEMYAPLKLNGEGNPSRYILPTLSITMAALRYRASLLLNRKSYLEEFRRIAHRIVDDPILGRLRVDPGRVRVYLHAGTGLVFLSLVSTARNYASYHADAWKSPVFYAAVLENNLYINTFLNCACYIVVISVHVVIPLLRKTVQVFEDAAKTMNILKLEEAIRCHETCCCLIETIDQVAGFLLGTLLIVAVPQIAMSFSHLEVLSRNTTSMIQFVAYSASTAISMLVFLYLASSIHQEAQKPDEILSVRIFTNREFETVSSQFMRRFQKKTFGYTFFGFFTFRRQTVLSVINITTTYLIVALQMKDL